MEVQFILPLLIVGWLGSSLIRGEDDLVCQKGATGFRGVTIPRGDILLKEGDTLEVYCRLDPALAAPYNASHIRFFFTKADVSEKAMKVRVLNETTALLRVERMNVSSPHLSCEIEPPGASGPRERKAVCGNEIDVGYPPLPVEEFRCLAPLWQTLNCTWKLPHNPIPTEYKIQIFERTRKQKIIAVYDCPLNTTTPTSCVWGPRTEPHYRANRNPINIIINGTNTLKPEGNVWSHDLNHWEIVTAETPTDLKWLKENATLTWSFKAFRDFPPGLVHEVKVCTQGYPELPCDVKIRDSKKGMDQMSVQVEMNYAYANYSLEVRMRSLPAPNDTIYWSTPAALLVTSDPELPSPPEVNVGSYESVPIQSDYRNVYIYWKAISPLYQKGPGFHYSFKVLEDEKEIDLLPLRVTSSYAEFGHLSRTKSYRFFIKSVNNVGPSLETSTIFVPKSVKAPGSPKGVSKLDFNNGSFIVSWNKVENSPVPIVSYTVFQCSSRMPRPYQCEGPLQWTVVNSTMTTKMFHYLPHDSTIYQFAVSGNSDTASSGMAWVSLCTLIHGKVPDKLRTVVLKNKGENSIHISWQLDCAYEAKTIIGYKIHYCPVAKRDTACTETEIQKGINDADTMSYTILGLQPCSTYKISVSIISVNGDSQKSDPIYGSTTAGAPSHPPDISVLSIRNTSAHLQLLPRFPLNGPLKSFYLLLTSNETKEQEERLFRIKTGPDGMMPDMCESPGVERLYEYELTDLAPNSGYLLTVAACTNKCSPPSGPLALKTLYGTTNMTTGPSLYPDGENVWISWELPKVLRGPIKNFQLLLKDEGGDEEMVDVPYESGSPDSLQYKRPCVKGKSLVVRVRAVSELEEGEIAYGAWSSENSTHCGGTAAILIFFGIAILGILMTGCVAFLVYKIYQKLRGMREVIVKLPPGLAVQDLNGFSSGVPKRRKNSEGDTHSFGKEGYNYPMQMTGPMIQPEEEEGTKITESCLQEEIENESLLAPGIESGPEVEEEEDEEEEEQERKCVPFPNLEEPAVPDVVLPPMGNGNTSYVQWSQIPTPKATNPQPTPYCQVGILLDSN